MKGFAMLGINKVGWIEKEKPVVSPVDAIVRPLVLSPCASDGKLDTSLLLTHRFKGFENIEQALYMMKDKPSDIDQTSRYSLRKTHDKHASTALVKKTSVVTYTSTLLLSFF